MSSRTSRPSSIHHAGLRLAFQTTGDLQMKVETSQEKLVRYQKEHEILGTDEKTNIITEKLDELNKEMTAAERIAWRRKRSTARLSPTIPMPSRPRSLPTARETRAPPPPSLVIARAAGQPQNPVADLSTQFGPQYPKVAQLNSQLKEIDHQLQSETNKAVDHLQGSVPGRVTARKHAARLF